MVDSSGTASGQFIVSMGGADSSGNNLYVDQTTKKFTWVQLLNASNQGYIVDAKATVYTLKMPSPAGASSLLASATALIAFALSQM